MDISTAQLVPYFNKSKITVCVSDWTPAVYCLDRDPAEYSGFEVELFKRVMPYLGWDDSMIQWKCLGWDEMLDDLYASKVCDLAPAGFQPRAERIEQGLRFSVSSLRTGFSIMVMRQQESPGIWYIFSAMDPIVWVAMFLTGCVIGVIVWLFEVGMRALNHDTRFVSSIFWDTVGKFVQMRDYRLSSSPANLTALMWTFLVFIVMVLYSANLTANLTVSQIKNDIKGVTDLPGKAVATWDGYLDVLKEYNIGARGYPWDGPDDEQKMINDLRSGMVRAVVLDDSTLQILDASQCDTMLVGDQFNGFEQCVAFPRSTWENYPGFVEAYNRAVYKVIEERGVEELIHRFIDIPEAPCKNSELSSGYSSVSFSQVAGLWVILAVSVGVGILCVVFYRLWGKYKSRFQDSKWFRCICPCIALPASQRISRSMTYLVNTGFKKNDDEDPMWNYRYQGASAGYIDGSLDAIRSEEMYTRPGERPRHAASLSLPSRSSSKVPPHELNFQNMVLAELASLKQQIARMNTGSQVSSSDVEPGAEKHVSFKEDLTENV